MSHKGDTSTQSRMTFYSELSNLRRSALIKYEENENLTAIKDSYRVYIIGPESSDKHELIRTFYCSMHNQLKPLAWAKEDAFTKTVQLTPNRQYDVRSTQLKNMQIRRGTLLVEPTLPLEPKNLHVYEDMFARRMCSFPLCVEPYTRGDSVIITLRLGAELKQQERNCIRRLVQILRSQEIDVFIVLTHFNTVSKEIRTIKDAQRLQNNILSVCRDLKVERERVFMLQCYSRIDIVLNEEINFYALNVMEEVMKSCSSREAQKSRGWFCELFN